MVVRLDAEYKKIEEDYGLNWQIAMVSEIKDDEGKKTIKPRRIRIRITDRITGMEVLRHDRPGRGPDDELTTVKEALDLAKHTDKPMTPAQLAQKVDVQNEEIQALQNLLATPEGAAAVEKQCKTLKAKLRQKGISWPKGSKANDMAALRLLESELDKAEQESKDDVSEGGPETAPTEAQEDSEGHDQGGPDNRADETSPVTAGLSGKNEDSF